MKDYLLKVINSIYYLRYPMKTNSWSHGHLRYEQITSCYQNSFNFLINGEWQIDLSIEWKLLW